MPRLTRRALPARRTDMINRVVFGGLVLFGVVCALTAANAADEPGQALYEGHCGQCHGAEGRGGRAPRLVPFAWSYEQALEQIRHPVCDMPPIAASDVSDAEVAQIVAYLKTIR
jgi:mono/diheme cytochrome c family protein